MREQLPKARRAFGAEHDIVMRFRWTYAKALRDGSLRDCSLSGKVYVREASRDDLAESTAVLEELSRTARRVYGPVHPVTDRIQKDHEASRSVLAAFDAS